MSANIYDIVFEEGWKLVVVGMALASICAAFYWSWQLLKWSWRRTESMIDAWKGARERRAAWIDACFCRLRDMGYEEKWARQEVDAWLEVYPESIAGGERHE